MPGKDELRATLLATFMAPATDLVRTLSAGTQNFMYLLSAQEKAKAASGS
jgi:large subunit ribosomal protein L10